MLNPRAPLLLWCAAGLEYDDRAEELNSVVDRAVQQARPAREWSRRELPPFPDTHSPEAQEALREWLRLLHIDVKGEVCGRQSAPILLSASHYPARLPFCQAIAQPLCRGLARPLPVH